jgi:hypothetical protein
MTGKSCAAAGTTIKPHTQKARKNDLMKNVLGFWDTLKGRLAGILGEQEECQRF